MHLNKYIDHTLLSPTATGEDIKILCQEAEQYGFYAVCVNSAHVKYAKKILNNSDVKIAAAIGFPLGASSSEAKTAEAKSCIADGADEIDMVMNLGHFKAEEYKTVQTEIDNIKKLIGNKILKVIIETCYLDDKEIAVASEIVMNAGADFVKTSTGFGERGASLRDVHIMQKAVGESIKIKASGGIRDAETAMEYINNGVARIGTSSAIKIVTGR